MSCEEHYECVSNCTACCPNHAQLTAALKVVEGFRRINFHENTYDAGVYIVEAHEADRATQALAELDALRGSEK